MWVFLLICGIMDNFNKCIPEHFTDHRKLENELKLCCFLTFKLEQFPLSEKLIYFCLIIILFPGSMIRVTCSSHSSAIFLALKVHNSHVPFIFWSWMSLTCPSHLRKCEQRVEWSCYLSVQGERDGTSEIIFRSYFLSSLWKGCSIRTREKLQKEHLQTTWEGARNSPYF